MKGLSNSKSAAVIITVVVAAASVLLGISAGSVHIPVREIITAAGVRLFGQPLPKGMSPNTVNIIMDIRTPRVLLAFLTGAALSASGAVVQSALRNPLGSPYTLGVSSGASLGAALVIASGLAFSGDLPWLLRGLRLLLPPCLSP